MIARHLEIAKELYPELPLPLDRLAFRKEYEPIHEKFCQLAGCELEPNQTWNVFLSLRKRGHAPRRDGDTGI